MRGILKLFGGRAIGWGTLGWCSHNISSMIEVNFNTLHRRGCLQGYSEIICRECYWLKDFRLVLSQYFQHDGGKF